MIKNIFSDCQKRLYDKSGCDTARLSEVHRQIVPDSRSSCTEGSVAEVGAKRTNVSRAGLQGGPQKVSHYDYSS